MWRLETTVWNEQIYRLWFQKNPGENGNAPFDIGPYTLEVLVMQKEAVCHEPPACQKKIGFVPFPKPG